MSEGQHFVDAVIIGSGFSGSLLARILCSRGWRIVLIDRGRHPRFAIGESTTPIADLLLAELAHNYQLEDVASLASYGAWKQHHPEVICGLKRGFSYFQHERGLPFTDDQQHSRSWFVAASREDFWSDTHWLRSSVDQFLAQGAVTAGVDLREQTQVATAEFRAESHRWTLRLQGVGSKSARSETLECRWLIDASGGAEVVSRLVGNPRDDDWMLTRTRAVWGHFSGVGDFRPQAAAGDPFAGDHAAQHHLTEDGWCWMLRMDNGITSVGLVQPSRLPEQQSSVASAESLQQRLAAWPELSAMMSEAVLVAPEAGLQSSPRLSRCRRSAAGNGWVLLPQSCGFVDPLHSTGISHSLSGVSRIAAALLADSRSCSVLLQQYSRDVPAEIRWIDQLVAGCYLALPSFPAFQAACALYFLSAIGFEQTLIEQDAGGRLRNGFLGCHDLELREIWREADRSLQACSSLEQKQQWAVLVGQMISQRDPVGLLDPAQRNRIAHTAAPKHAALRP